MSALAGEFDNPGANKIIVNKAENTITFIYDETNTDLMNQWEALYHFNDVADDAWYQMYVSHLTQLDIIDKSVNFFPESATTRAEFTKMLALIANADLSSQNETNSISDFSENIQQSAIQWAVSNNISHENIDNFRPNDFITNQEATEMLFALAEFQNSSALSTYSKDIALAEYKINEEQSNEYQETNQNISQEINNISLQIEPIQIISKLINYDNESLHPSDILKHCEAAKMLSFYIVLNERPTLITETTPIEYIDEVPSNENISMGMITDESFHTELIESDLHNSNELSPNWTSSETNEYTSVHKNLTNQGFYILFQDKKNSITNITGKYSSKAREYIYEGSILPDQLETDLNTFVSHYCNKNLLNKNLGTNPTAYTQANNHYYSAKMYYDWANYEVAYKQLGMSIHYFEDVTSPPHAALITGSAHKLYEIWVRNNFRNEYYTTYATASTYNFMSQTTFRDIFKNFATLSGDVADVCIRTNSNSIAPTRDCLHKAQRAVAGLGYKYLIDTGRNN